MTLMTLMMRLRKPNQLSPKLQLRRKSRMVMIMILKSMRMTVMMKNQMARRELGKTS